MFVCAECGASQPVQGSCIADGTPLMPVGEDLLLGTTIGVYRVARLLGLGGMGRVYKGVHPQIGSRVAIKVLSRECSDRRDLVDRFFSEAKAVNLIRHESIVNVLDLATLPDGRPYIIMEYLDGSPLASIVEQAQHGAPLPLGGLARLVAEVLDALGSAHSKGIVHRDLKPDNIYVTPAGRPKVLDFGIAKLQPELGGSSTHTGSLMGTPHYMSPEQASGRPVDQRADLYAIGVILFECATLQRPFNAPALFDLLRMHVEAPPPSPRALRPEMPEGLEHVILTALAKHPDQRFVSAQAMSMALQHATMQLPPEHWAPITPAHSSRTSHGGWAPTPPASWAGSQRPAIAQQATQTAGQVTPQTTPRSRTGLWIALGATLLVVGGITAVVIASSGGKPTPVPSNEGSGSAIAIGSGSGSSADLWGDPAPPPAPVPVPVADEGQDAIEDAEERADDAKDRADQAKERAEAEALIAASNDAMLDGFFSNLPAESRKALPADVKAALKKYGRWSKIPTAQRKQLAVSLSGMTGAMAASMMGDFDAAFADIPTSSPPAPAPTPPPKPAAPPTSAGLGPDGWVNSRKFSAPAGFDAKKADVAKYLPFAIAEAKKLVPDAVLMRIDTRGVYPTGHADLTAVDHGSLDFRFISPSRAKRDPNLPAGAKQEKHCMFRVQLDQTGAWSAPIKSDCKEPLLGPPKCSVVQIWKKALAAKAPANALASISYYASLKGEAKWFFNITDEDTKFSQQFPDDC